MGHKVRFEPVGVEIEVEEDETVLNGAFRQGVTLMHGCKEGQCSACKSFLLDGEMDMERYSTFALADYEKEEGYVLLCRAHAYSDLEVELINYDEDMLTSGVPIQEVRTEVAAVDTLTHDIRRLLLRLVEPKEMLFSAGQYVDIGIPGTNKTRAFSMANTPETDGQLEFLIKLYPDGAFSTLLDGLKPGDELTAKGPYGMCTLRPNSERDMVLVGGGAGMAPLLGLVRSLADKGSTRKATFYYGARQATDLFYLDELKELEARLPAFKFVPALSEVAPSGDDWEGETGLITELLERNEGDLADHDAYLCGPPPMIDAAIPVLSAKGVDEAHMYFDKFTVSADAEGGGGG